MVEVETLLTFFGETDGTSTSGTFELDGDFLHAKVSYIRPDKGTKLKIWAKRISGERCLVHVEQTEDVTVATPTWKKIGSFYLSSAGEIAEEKRRPIVAQSRDGKQAIRFTWELSPPAKTYVGFEVEFLPAS